jgi:hypothetical protein
MIKAFPALNDQINIIGSTTTRKAGGLDLCASGVLARLGRVSRLYGRGKTKARQCFIVVVKKTFRYSNVFSYNHLYQPECFYEKRYKRCGCNPPQADLKTTNQRPFIKKNKGGEIHETIYDSTGCALQPGMLVSVPGTTLNCPNNASR